MVKEGDLGGSKATHFGERDLPRPHPKSLSFASQSVMSTEQEGEREGLFGDSNDAGFLTRNPNLLSRHRADDFVREFAALQLSRAFH